MSGFILDVWVDMTRGANHFKKVFQLASTKPYLHMQLSLGTGHLHPMFAI